MARVAFVGLGNMGGPMSANLVKAGHEVAGYDIVAGKREAAAAGGVAAAASSADAARGADFVFAMLPTGKEVREVLVDHDRLLDSVAAGAVVVDSSTTDLETTGLVHAAAAARGVAFVDSPVSGGMAGAQAATLTFMAGGRDDAISRAEPVFLAMGRKVVRAGGPCAGQAVKACNNMLLGISMAGACEALALGEAAGVSRQVLFDVISSSTGSCWSVNVNCPLPGMVETAPANRGYRPGFTATLMLKDLTLAQEAAARTGARAPLGELARALYERFCDEFDGELDFSAMIRMARNAGGRPAAAAPRGRPLPNARGLLS